MGGARVHLGGRREVYHHDGCVGMVGLDLGVIGIGIAISDMASTISGYAGCSRR
jgi:hypothetical protein